MEKEISIEINTENVFFELNDQNDYLLNSDYLRNYEEIIREMNGDFLQTLNNYSQIFNNGTPVSKQNL